MYCQWNEYEKVVERKKKTDNYQVNSWTLSKKTVYCHVISKYSFSSREKKPYSKQCEYEYFLCAEVLRTHEVPSANFDNSKSDSHSVHIPYETDVISVVSTRCSLCTAQTFMIFIIHDWMQCESHAVIIILYSY